VILASGIFETEAEPETGSFNAMRAIPLLGGGPGVHQ